jgi:hypothetical protein
VVAASWIEHRATGWALVGALQVLPDREFRPASAAQNSSLVPLSLRPDFKRVAGQCVMTVLARKVDTATLHLDRDDIHWLAVMRAAGLSVKTNSVYVGTSI